MHEGSIRQANCQVNHDHENTWFPVGAKYWQYRLKVSNKRLCFDKISVLVNSTQIFSQFRFFKLNPEIRSQYFGFLAGLSDEEMRLSPWLIQHASGVVLGVTQIVNGLENPVLLATGNRG